MTKAVEVRKLISKVNLTYYAGLLLAVLYKPDYTVFYQIVLD